MRKKIIDFISLQFVFKRFEKRNCISKEFNSVSERFRKKPIQFTVSPNFIARALHSKDKRLFTSAGTFNRTADPKAINFSFISLLICIFTRCTVQFESQYNAELWSWVHVPQLKLSYTENLPLEEMSSNFLQKNECPTCANADCP